MSPPFSSPARKSRDVPRDALCHRWCLWSVCRTISQQGREFVRASRAVEDMVSLAELVGGMGGTGWQCALAQRCETLDQKWLKGQKAATPLGDRVLSSMGPVNFRTRLWRYRIVVTMSIKFKSAWFTSLSLPGRILDGRFVVSSKVCVSVCFQCTVRMQRLDRCVHAT